MLVDANLLLYGVDAESRYHDAASAWLTDRLNGPRRVAFAWQSLGAFLRISTNPRAVEHPLTPGEAWAHVQRWLAASPSWTPLPTERHAAVLGELITKYELRGNLVPDAQLAALAVEHGLTVCSTDTDFARFTEVRWIDPLRQSS